VTEPSNSEPLPRVEASNDPAGDPSDAPAEPEGGPSPLASGGFNGSARRPAEAVLGDFTTTPAILRLVPLAVVIGVLGAGISLALLDMIGFFTNLLYFQRLSVHLVSPYANRLGAIAVVIPVGGGLIVGLMARFGSEQIRGHGIPEAMERILINGSKVQPRLAILKPIEWEKPWEAGTGCLGMPGGSALSRTWHDVPTGIWFPPQVGSLRERRHRPSQHTPSRGRSGRSPTNPMTLWTAASHGCPTLPVVPSGRSACRHRWRRAGRRPTPRVLLQADVMSLRACSEGLGAWLRCPSAYSQTRPPATLCSTRSTSASGSTAWRNSSSVAQAAP